MRILLVEDEVGLSDALVHMLKVNSYSVMAVYDGESGLFEALTGTYDAVILDVMLPKMDGISVLQQLRAEKIRTPVILLTARSSLDDRVEGLDSGADYYLTKPFATRELLACLRAVLRRPDALREDDPQFGDLLLQASQGCISCSATGKSIRVSAKELHLLQILMAEKGRIVPKDTLLDRIWGLESSVEYNNLEVYVSFVRKKLSHIGSRVTIRSTRGLGYSVEVQP